MGGGGGGGGVQINPQLLGRLTAMALHLTASLPLGLVPLCNRRGNTCSPETRDALVGLVTPHCC